jgi:hypothetical protein
MALLFFLCGVIPRFIFGDFLSRAERLRKSKRISKKIPLILFLFLVVTVFFLFGILMAYLPGFHPPSLTSLAVVTGCSLILLVSGLRSIRAVHPWAAVMFGFTLTFLMLAASIHFLGVLIPGWIWFLPLIGVFLLTWSLPLINARWAQRISDGQFAPKTRLGRACLSLAWRAMGIAGVGGAMFGLHASKHPNGVTILVLVLGVMWALISVALSQTYAYQLWRQFQEKDRDPARVEEEAVPRPGNPISE